MRVSLGGYNGENKDRRVVCAGVFGWVGGRTNMYYCFFFPQLLWIHIHPFVKSNFEDTEVCVLFNRCDLQR